MNGTVVGPNSTFGKIYYDKLVLENVKGQVIVKDEAINLNNLFANLLNGSATINAKYNTKNTDHPDGGSVPGQGVGSHVL